MSDPSTQESIDVRIEDNAARARLTIPGSLPPASVQPDKLLYALQERGVVVDEAITARLEEVSADFEREPRDLDLIIAEAEPAEDGEDGWIEWMPGFNPEIEPARSTEDPESVDFYNKRSWVKVTEGTHIATLHYATPGKEGRDVTGAPIKQRPGRPLLARPDDSINVEDDGRAIAVRDGVLSVMDNRISISRHLEIKKDVDFNTGNIDFDGSVVVHRSVRDRFTVKATGAISIHGMVEASTIICGGNLLLERGIAGRDRGEIIVEGDARIGYLNDAKGRVNGNLSVLREIINCDFTVGGKLDIETGSIIGGRTTVSGGVKAEVIGSDADIPTVLVLGTLPLITFKIRQLKSQLASVEEEIQAANHRFACMGYARASLSEEEREAASEFRAEIDAMAERRDNIQAELDQLATRARQGGKVSVNVQRVIHPKVVLHVDGSVYVFEKPLRGPVWLGFDSDHQLVYKDSGGNIHPIGEIARLTRSAA